MTKAIEFFKRNKKLLTICICLFALVLIAVAIKLSTSDVTSGTSKTQTETKLAAVLERMDGVGEVNVMVTENDDGEILGVVVVCEGADNIMTRNDILNAVSTALNVERNMVAVYAMN